MKCLLVVACFGCLVTAAKVSSNNTTAIYILQKQVKQLLPQMCKVGESKTCKGMKRNATIKRYRDCYELFIDGYVQDGVYRIWLTHGYRWISVFCDMQTISNDTGKRGWITVQRRMNGKVNFDRGWKDYVEGFGVLNEEHWIGLNNLYDLVRQKQIGTYNKSEIYFYGMRFDLEDWDGYSGYAESTAIKMYSEKYSFEISDVGTEYFTEVFFHPIGFIKDTSFVTYDHNEDRFRDYCEFEPRGGWWHRDCRHSNLNGIYSTEKEMMIKEKIFVADWMKWNQNKTALRYVSIKIG